METFELVETVGTEEEATLVVGFLETHGIKASIESLFFHQEPMSFGQLGEVRILVATEEADRARRLLASREGESPDARDTEEEV